MAFVVKPHRDISLGEHCNVRTALRKALARNLQARMEAYTDLRTQPALAGRAKIAQSHVSRVLRGESAATVDMLEAIAGALGCQPWELLADSDRARREALERMILGPRVADDVAAKHLPPAPKSRKPR